MYMKKPEERGKERECMCVSDRAKSRTKGIKGFYEKKDVCLKSICIPFSFSPTPALSMHAPHCFLPVTHSIWFSVSLIRVHKSERTTNKEVYNTWRGLSLKTSPWQLHGWHKIFILTSFLTLSEPIN